METSPEQSSSNPQEAYEQRYNVALDYLAGIRAKITVDANNGQPKDWADAGNMGHTVEVLEELATFLGA